MEEFSAFSVKFTSPGSHCSHNIFYKAHSLKKTSERTPNGRTLFTLGWPPFVRKHCIEKIFARVGHVTDVILQLRGGSVEANNCITRGFKVAYVVMSCASEMTSALKLCSLSSPIHSPTPPLGLTLWTHQYMTDRPSIDSLETSVAMAIEEYDIRVEAAKEKRKRAVIPDADGWITVTSRGNKRKLTTDDSSENKRKTKKKELLNFYSWQMRETQREEIAKLRYKFQEDKEKVAAMRAARKFKPY